MTPGAPDDDQPLTPEEIEALREVARAVRAGRSVVWALLRAGAFATGLAAMAYYVLGILNGWNIWSAHR